MLQKIKDWLVHLGPNNWLTQIALSLHGRRAGFTLHFADSPRIWLMQGNRKMALHQRDLTFVPVMMECFDLFFDGIVSTHIDGDERLDFSQPAFHTYRHSGMGFFFPSIPEEDPLDQYTHWYKPKSGDVIWDASAYCGATSCLLASLVGPQGKVYAFEPDELNYTYLLKNIAHHGFTNIVPVPKALSGSSGTAKFFMNGTMASGISDLVVYSDDVRSREVPTLTMEDACKELGSVPTYIKMDIEGAELSFVQQAKEFLKLHPVHFAIESCHRVHGVYTYKGLDPLFKEIGYDYLSSDIFKQMFTWARPRISGLAEEPAPVPVPPNISTHKTLLQRLAGLFPAGQVLRYLCVGVFNTLFGYATFALTLFLLNHSVPQRYLYLTVIAASLISTPISITVAYFGYKLFVFKTHGNHLREWLKAFGVYGVGILPGLLVLSALTRLLQSLLHHKDYAGYAAGALVQGFTVIISFLGHRNITFKPNTASA